MYKPYNPQRTISGRQMAQIAKASRQKIMDQNQHYAKTGEWLGGRPGPPAGAMALRIQRLENENQELRTQLEEIKNNE